MKNYYIPIKSTSLAHYFSKASVYPTKYLSNRIEDIQNKYKDFILISNKKWIENSDCYLEIVVTDDEIMRIKKISRSFNLIDFPIPITRIRNICFTNKEQKDTTIWNINSGAAFVPSELLRVEHKKGKDIADERELNNINVDVIPSDLTEKIKKYDEILGGFALMQLGGETFMNYSPNYFDTLTHFNSLIEEEIKKVKKEINKKYYGVFNENSKEWGKITAYIGESLTVEEVKKIAKDEKVHLEEKYGLLDIDSINQKSYLYLLSIFATYGDRNRKSVDDFIALILSDKFLSDRKEGIALLFGMNNGYSNFRNKYKIREIEKDVKFRLDSKLDYYTIESIFQNVFNDKTENTEFKYLDNWCPKQKPNSIRGFKIFRVLDKAVISKKKYPITSQEYLQEYLRENPTKTFYSIITDLVNSWLPPFIKTKDFTLDGQKYFESKLKEVFSNYLWILIKNVASDSKEEFNEEQLNASEKLVNEKKELERRIEVLSEDKRILENRVIKSEKELTDLKKIIRQLKLTSPELEALDTDGDTYVEQIGFEKEEEKILSINEPRYDYNVNQDEDWRTELTQMEFKQLRVYAKEKYNIAGRSKEIIIDKIIKIKEEDLGFN